MTMKLFSFLQQQEEYGWYVDQDWMAVVAKRLEKRIERIDKAVLPHLPLVLEALS